MASALDVKTLKHGCFAITSQPVSAQQTALFVNENGLEALLKFQHNPNSKAILVNLDVYTRWTSLQKTLNFEASDLADLLLNLFEGGFNDNQSNQFTNSGPTSIFPDDSPELCEKRKALDLKQSHKPSPSPEPLVELIELKPDTAEYLLQCENLVGARSHIEPGTSKRKRSKPDPEEYLTDEDANEDLFDSILNACCSQTDPECPYNFKSRILDYHIAFNGYLNEMSLNEIALSSLPDVLEMKSSKSRRGRQGVWIKSALPKGALFGPYIGFFSGTYIKQHWEMFCLLSKHRKPLEYYRELLTVDEDSDAGLELDCEIEFKKKVHFNWMVLVACGRHESESNLDVVIHKDRLFYCVTQDLKPGTELLLYVDQERDFSCNQTINHQINKVTSVANKNNDNLRSKQIPLKTYSACS